MKTNSSKTHKRRKVPLSIKILDKESGAVSMSMIFNYYGLFLNREKAREEAGVTEKGTSADRIQKAMVRNGFDATLKNIEMLEMEQLFLPAIVKLKNDKFAVVTKISKQNVYLNDPESGREKISRQEFSNVFAGQLIEAYPNESFQPGGEKGNLLSYIKQWLGKDSKIIVYVFILGLILIIPNIIFPASYKIFLDNILGLQQDYFYKPLIIVLIGLMLFTGALTFIQQRLVTRLEVKMALISSANFFRHLLKLPLPFFLGRFPGELGKRIPLNANLALVFAADLPKIVLNVISIILYSIVMLNYNVLLTIIGVVFSLLSLWSLKVITAKREALNQIIVQNRGKVYNVSMVGLQMIETIKASASENDFFEHWAGYQTNMVNNDQKLGYINKFLDILPAFLKSLNNIVMICLGTLLVIYGSMTIGTLVAFQALMDTFSKPVSDIINNGGKIQDAAAYLTTLKDALDTTEDEVFTEVDINPITQVTPADAKLNGELELRNVQFGYNKYEEPLIKDFSIKLTPGKSVALVGSSGSGKSTIAKLIVGINKLWGGEILIDGKNIKKYPSVILASSLSMVDQKVFLFNGTVNENITMWNKSTPQEHIVKAAKDACIDDVINERNGSFESIVLEDGKNYSGGQRQRLEIARALVNNPSILILDEATSALDPNSEKVIMNNLKKRACTSLIIAHRLSTIRDCDEIIVLDTGTIVQRGTHEELLKDKKGKYYKLVKLT